MNNTLSEKPIGIFDSGLGGLTVTAALQEIMPNEKIIYLGDTARVPYGDKSPETVKRFGKENALFLAKQDVKLIICACNTVSSIAICEIRKFFKKNKIEIPVIGVLEAGVNEVVKTKHNNIAVIGTRATISSNAYECEIRKKSTSIKVRSIPCPLFAPIVEEGLANHEIAKQAFQLYLSDLHKNRPDSLLLGCTHYPLLIKSLKEYLPASVKIIDSAHAVANFAKEFISDKKIQSSNQEKSMPLFFSTDSPKLFKTHATNFLGKEIEKVNKAVIDGILTNY